MSVANPPRSPRIALALAVLGGAAGVAWWVASPAEPSARRPVTPTAEPAPPEDAVEAALTAADEAIDAEDWSECLRRYAAVLATDATHEEATLGQRFCATERANQSRWQTIESALAAERWAEARAAASDFPDDSVYTARAREAGARISRLRRAAWHRQRAERTRAERAEKVAALRARVANARPVSAPRGDAIAWAEALDGASDELAAVFAEDPPDALEGLEAIPLDTLERADLAARRAPGLEPDDDGAEGGDGDDPLADEVEQIGDDLEALLAASHDADDSGDRERAVALLERAAELEPDNHLPRKRLCAALRAHGSPEAALEHCRAWRDREPDADARAVLDAQLARAEEELELR